MSVQMFKRLRWIAGGAVVLQVSACFGPQPQTYLAGTVATTLVSEVVSLLFGLLTSGLAAAA